MKNKDTKKFETLLKAINTGDLATFRRKLRGVPKRVLQMTHSPDGAHPTVVAPADGSGGPTFELSLTLLEHACAEGQAEMVKLLIAAGCRVNGSRTCPVPLLVFAVRSGDVETVTVLLRSGADPSNCYANRFSCVELAAVLGHIGMVWEILKAKGDLPDSHLRVMDGEAAAVRDVYAPDAVGATPLHWAAYKGDCDAIAALLERGADVDAANLVGQTPAHWAAAEGRVQATALLIKSGADSRRSDEFGHTCFSRAAERGHLPALKHMIKRCVPTPKVLGVALHCAVEEGRRDAVSLLLKHGADTETPRVPTAIAVHCARMPMGLEPLLAGQPLYHALCADDLDIARQLLEAGADVNARAGEFTPLIALCKRDDPEAVQLLLDHGADTELSGERGMTALHATVLQKSVECARLLLSNGAEIDAQDEGGRTPLSYACARDAADLVALLLDEGADVHAKDRQGAGLLNYAALGDNERTLYRLLELGLDVHAVDFDGAGPMHLAAMADNVQMIELLLRLGVPVDGSTNIGVTPLISAAVQGSAGVIPVLIKAGADINVRDDDGHTPLLAAARAGHVSVAKQLVKLGANPEARLPDGRDWQSLIAQRQMLNAFGPMQPV